MKAILSVLLLSVLLVPGSRAQNNASGEVTAQETANWLNQFLAEKGGPESSLTFNTDEMVSIDEYPCGSPRIYTCTYTNHLQMSAVKSISMDSSGYIQLYGSVVTYYKDESGSIDRSQKLGLIRVGAHETLSSSDNTRLIRAIRHLASLNGAKLGTASPF
jgi:hypothetical protein